MAAAVSLPVLVSGCAHHSGTSALPVVGDGPGRAVGVASPSPGFPATELGMAPPAVALVNGEPAMSSVSRG